MVAIPQGSQSDEREKDDLEAFLEVF